MDFMELERMRSAVRTYEERHVEQEKLDQILEAAHIAPTAANRQSQRLLVVRKEEMKELEGAVNLHGADTAIIVCSDTRCAWVRGYDQMNAGVIDASIVTTMMMMEAVQQGLGTLWVCAFDPEKISAFAHLEEGVIPVNILCLGYTSSKADPQRFTSTRKPLDELMLNI